MRAFEKLSAGLGFLNAGMAFSLFVPFANSLRLQSRLKKERTITGMLMADGTPKELSFITARSLTDYAARLLSHN